MPSLPTDSNPVTAVSAAASADALAHFSALLQYETDCWDVHAALERRQTGFVLLDVRSPEQYARGHVPGADNLPHARIVERNVASYATDVVFVVYCNGPHCNGADRAAIALARLGRPVKKMIGGVTGWLDEGFALATGERRDVMSDAENVNGACSASSERSGDRRSCGSRSRSGTAAHRSSVCR